MTGSVVLLGLSFHNRFNLRRPPTATDAEEDDVGAAWFSLRRELAPSPSSSPILRALCADGVQVTVSSGSVVVRVDGLNRPALQCLAEADLAELSTNANWNLWLERCEALQVKNKPRVVVDDVVWVGRLDAVGEFDKPATTMEHCFIRWNPNSPLSARFAGPSLARHLLNSVRSLVDDGRCMIWFGSSGRTFTYSTFSPALIGLYSKMFASANAPRGFAVATAAHSHAYDGEAGFFVFSQAGLVPLASKFVNDVVDSTSAESAGEFDVDFDGDAVVRFGDAAETPQVVAPWLVLFVDASGCDFDDNPRLFEGLLSVLNRTRSSVRFVSLFGCSMTDEQFAIAMKRVENLSCVKHVLINEFRFESLQQNNKLLDVLVPGAVSSSMVFVDESRRQAMRARCARMQTLVTASMCRQSSAVNISI